MNLGRPDLLVHCPLQNSQKSWLTAKSNKGQSNEIFHFKPSQNDRHGIRRHRNRSAIAGFRFDARNRVALRSKR